MDARAEPGHDEGGKSRAMIRKIVTALILVPLAILFVAFAVANRQTVVVSLDPFDPTDPAFSITMPLFMLIIVLVIVGVMLGGVAAWLRQGKWRWRARYFEHEARELRAELDEQKRRSGMAAPATLMRTEDAPRLSIPPPVA
jgi:uncharacterized integral membrane protein